LVQLKSLLHDNPADTEEAIVATIQSACSFIQIHTRIEPRSVQPVRNRYTG